MKDGMVCLDRALSKLGIVSRSVAQKLIVSGKVKINGKIIDNPEYKVVPEKIKVEIDNQKVSAAKNFTIAFNKPKGLVTTTSDEKNRATVFSLLPTEYGKLVTVGRLDMFTTGLLLLTTNTRLADYLTDPKNKIPRVYIATVRGAFDENKKQQCLEGVLDQDEILKAQSIEILKSSNRESQLKIILEQGKNREIKRLMESQGNPVTKLKRISYGNIQLGELAPGQWREVPDFSSF